VREGGEVCVCVLGRGGVSWERLREEDNYVHSQVHHPFDILHPQ
jgi:hypothetical protein